MQPYQPGQPMQPIQPSRPTGVTILAILAIIGGVAGLCLGLLGALGSAALSANPSQNTTHINTGLVLVFSIIALVVGVGDLIFGIGALQLKPWAWTLGVGIEAIGIVLNIIEAATGATNVLGAIIGIAIAGVIIYYLFQPQVQRAFGRVS